MAKPKKRIYLINRDFQLRYSFAAVFVGIISTALTVTVILVPLYVFEILRIPRFLPLPILVSMFVAAALNIFIVGFMGVFITHRIAGPMFSLVRSFRKIEMGRWSGKLRLRENDDMKFVVRNFNELVDSLVRTCKEDLQLLADAKTQLEKISGNAQADEALIAVNILKTHIEGRIQEEPEFHPKG
jgi:hypothetical protein